MGEGWREYDLSLIHIYSVLFGNGLAPTAFLNVTSAEGGKYRLMTVGHGWASNEVFVLETKTGKRHEITQGLTAHFAPQFVDCLLYTSRCV